MNLSEMRRLLASRDLQLTKSLGQNFLHDGNQLRRIAAAAGLEGTDRILEIGPGLGPLTELLLAGAGEVTAVEKDGRLVEVLKDRFHGDDRFHLVHADALAWIRDEERDWSDWKVVSNLPYSVGSPILVELALAERPARRMVVTLQAEVIGRVAARPGTAEYGVLTLLAALRFSVSATFKVPRECFFPAPDVESACAVLDRRPAMELGPGVASAYVSAVKAGFGQRRKMMLKLLAEVWPREAVEAAMTVAAVAHTERAERVSREQFVEIARQLADVPSTGNRP
jgi:16S rRNA (adenine1518-N6/adenine1519-N6)-dimethyltransferase